MLLVFGYLERVSILTRQMLLKAAKCPKGVFLFKAFGGDSQ